MKSISTLSFFIFFLILGSLQSQSIDVGFEQFSGCNRPPGGDGWCRWCYQAEDVTVGRFELRGSLDPVGQICSGNGTFPFNSVTSNPLSLLASFEITCDIPAGKYFEIEGSCCDLFTGGEGNYCEGRILETGINYLKLPRGCEDIRDTRFIICDPGVRHYQVGNDGKRSFLNSFALGADEQDPFRVIADGCSSSLFELDDDQLVLSIEGGGSLEMQNSKTYIYRHPTKVEEGVKLKILTRSGNEVDVVKVEVLQPPVLFVHGLWGNSEGFSGMFSHFASSLSYDRTRLQISDYSGSNDESFALNLSVVPTDIDGMLKQLHEDKTAGNKVDVVGHSMGGLITRLYAQSFYYRDDINRIITLNTPHSGSQLGNFLQDDNLSQWRRDAICEIFVPYLVTDNLSSCDDGAIQDLAVGSSAISALNTGSLIDIPTHALASEIDIPFTIIQRSYNLSSMFYLLTGLQPTQYNSIFGNQSNDGIVTTASQRGGLSDGFIFDDSHVGITNNESAAQYVINLLGIDRESGVFERGFSPVPQSYVSPFNQGQNDEELEFSIGGLSDLIEREYGNSMDVFLNASPASLTDAIASIGGQIFSDLHLNFGDNSGQISASIELRPQSLGSNLIHFYAKAGNNDGFETREIYITTAQVPVSIQPQASRIRMTVGETRRLNFVGHFANFDVELARDTNAVFSFSRGFKVEAAGEGWVRALRVGNDTVRLTFNGIVSEPLVIEVYNDSSILTSFSEPRRASSGTNFLVYPNPASTVITLALNQITELPVDAELKIYNVQGQLMKEIKHIHEIDNQIDISSLASSVYIVLVEVNGRLYRSKFVKH